MRRIKALSLLLFAAIAATALVAPAGASAVEWRGGNLTGGKSGPIEFNGPVTWQVGGSGLTCPVHAAGTLSPGNKGEITSFDVDGTPGKSACGGWAAYKNCEITGTGTVPLSLEAKSTNEALITKPKVGGVSDRILWTWKFKSNGWPCGPSGNTAGDTWKIRSDLAVGALSKGGFLTGFGESSLSSLEFIKVDSNGGEKTFPAILNMNWAISPLGTYWIGG